MWEIRGLALAWAIAAALAPAAGAANYALVVGVNSCPNFQLPGNAKFPQLRGAENDAVAMRDLLLKFGFQKVKTLQGATASLDAIRQEFQLLTRNLSANDQFVFHFSGHGTQVRDVAPGKDEIDGLDEALCPSNVTVNGRNLLLDDELAGWLAAIPDGKVTVILDCCHSGTGIKAADNDELDRYLEIPGVRRVANQRRELPWEELKDVEKGPGKRVIAIFASGSNQPAVERQFLDLREHRGQFTRFLIDGLKSRRADISVAAITTLVKDRIDTTFNNKPDNKDRKQIPGYEAARPEWRLIEVK